MLSAFCVWAGYSALLLLCVCNAEVGTTTNKTDKTTIDKRVSTAGTGKEADPGATALRSERACSWDVVLARYTIL